MSVIRLSLLLGVSFACSAAAEEAFVTQLRLPARDMAVDAFAWRGEEGVSVERAAFERLGLVAPPGAAGGRVVLDAVPGLSYEEDASSSSIVLTCSGVCLPMQRVGSAADGARAAAADWGAYVNYDSAAEWREGASSLGGVAEINLFGPLGRGEAVMLARSDESVTRLSTHWVIDMPRPRLRLVAGDAAAPGAGGGVVRFAGVQLSRHFQLQPSFITHPTPTLSGQADTASTVELYIDGALRARESVQAGPFELDASPFVTGAGEAELVVTDVLGRRQTLTRPFFVSEDLLRPGLSDWSVGAGFVRENYGARDSRYAQALAMGRYRVGLSDVLTAEAAFDAARSGGVAEIAAVVAQRDFGQVRITRAQSSDGGANTLSYFRDAGLWSFGLQYEERDQGFLALGRESNARQAVAGAFNLRLGRYGSAGLTAASVDLADEMDARTLAISYAPELGRGSLGLRLAYAERERRELMFALNLSVPLHDEVMSSYALELDRRGASYRAGAQRPAPSEGGIGWRARASGGEVSRIDLGANYSGPLGESAARLARIGDETGVRAEHAGSIGWIEGRRFAGAPIRGAFALVDAGAPNVRVMRDGLRVGRSADNGLVLVNALTPNQRNIITIATNDLPVDRVQSVSDQHVTPIEGGGVVVRFDAAVQRLRETRVRFADGAAPARGATLIRARDGARFPVGGAGRVVLLGAVGGDQLTLEGRPECRTSTDTAELVLSCGGF